MEIFEKMVNPGIIQEKEAQIDGRRVHWLEAGRGDVLVFVHGWVVSSESFRQVIPLLAEDFKVFAPDLPGFGNSEELSEKHTIHRLCQSLTVFLKQLNLERISLIGSSMGGMVAIHFAYENSEKVKSLVLQGVPYKGRQFPFFPMMAGRLFLRGDSTWSLTKRALKTAFQAYPEFRKLLPKDREEMLADIERTSMRAARETLASMFDEDLTGRARELRMPVLIIDGQKASVFLEQERELSRLIPGSCLCLIEAVGHNLVREKPEAFVSEVRNFLKK